MASKHALHHPSSPKHVKRRRHQASVRSFFAPVHSAAHPVSPTPPSPPLLSSTPSPHPVIPSTPISVPSPPSLNHSPIPITPVTHPRLSYVTLHTNIDLQPRTATPHSSLFSSVSVKGFHIAPRTSRPTSRSKNRTTCPNVSHPSKHHSPANFNSKTTSPISPPCEPELSNSNSSSQSITNRPRTRLSILKSLKSELDADAASSIPDDGPGKVAITETRHPLLAKAATPLISIPPQCKRANSNADSSPDSIQIHHRPRLSPLKKAKSAEANPVIIIHDTPKHLQTKKKLHPFFATTAAAVTCAKERVKSSKPPAPALDAWAFPNSTVHVNVPIPSYAWGQKPRLSIYSSTLAPTHKTFLSAHKPIFSFNSATDSSDQPQHCIPRPRLEQHISPHHTLWAEHYKNDRRIDVINGSVAKQLIDWLRDWYDKPRLPSTDSIDSIDSFMSTGADNTERVAIITGPTGCGKSTLIAIAARQLGLSILEINASTCRTGKAIRHIIGDALNTHRVSHSSSSSLAFNNVKLKIPHSAQAKTLIVFEEVDAVHVDEKGFWSAFQKLAAASDCRRPLICTATSFNAQMRQVFAETKLPIEADLQRVLVNATTEQAVNPPLLGYKHIHFSPRTERQSAAVLKRISTSESAKAVVEMNEYLGTICRSDTRRAVNLLQFWGSRGLESETDAAHYSVNRSTIRRMKEMQYRVGLDIMRAVSQDFAVSTIFGVGSMNYVKKQKKSSRQVSANTNDVLDTWTTSLEALSAADNLRGASERQRCIRKSIICEDAEEGICMDADLENILREAEDVDVEAVHFSRNSLIFGHGPQQLHDLSQESMHEPDSIQKHLPSCLTSSRRAILTEYIPALRTMAIEHGKQSRTTAEKGERALLSRRTRSCVRRDSFSSLNLDPKTVSVLKKISARS